MTRTTMDDDENQDKNDDGRRTRTTMDDDYDKNENENDDGRSQD